MELREEASVGKQLCSHPETTCTCCRQVAAQGDSQHQRTEGRKVTQKTDRGPLGDRSLFPTHRHLSTQPGRGRDTGGGGEGERGKERDCALQPRALTCRFKSRAASCTGGWVPGKGLLQGWHHPSRPRREVGGYPGHLLGLRYILAETLLPALSSKTGLRFTCSEAQLMGLAAGHEPWEGTEREVRSRLVGMTEAVSPGPPG